MRDHDLDPKQLGFAEGLSPKKVKDLLRRDHENTPVGVASTATRVALGRLFGVPPAYFFPGVQRDQAAKESPSPQENIKQNVLEVSGAELFETWNTTAVLDAISASQHGEELVFVSTYYPFSEYTNLYNRILGLCGSIGAPSCHRSRLKIRIVFVDPAEKRILDTRFRLFDDNRPRNPRKDIVRQASTFLRLGRKYSKVVDIKVRFYTGWPWGHAFRFGDRAIFYAPMLASNTAITGPQTVVRNPRSQFWLIMERNFEITQGNGPIVTPQVLRSYKDKIEGS